MYHPSKEFLSEKGEVNKDEYRVNNIRLNLTVRIKLFVNLKLVNLSLADHSNQAKYNGMRFR